MRQACGLADPEEAWEYVMMQKDYQHRIMICDRDDFGRLRDAGRTDALSGCTDPGGVSTDARAWGDSDGLEKRDET